MKILLLAGTLDNYEEPWALKLHEGEPIIDWQIKKLSKMGHEVIVIIDQLHADKIIAGSKQIHKCELIYDNHDDEASQFTNTYSGLFIVHNYCYALPVHTPAPDKWVFNDLTTHFFRKALDEDADLVNLYYPQNGKLIKSPLILITKKGKYNIKTMEDLNSLDDEKLTASHLTILDKSIIAQV